jgi:serine/threonine protein phosphatase PrpC
MIADLTTGRHVLGPAGSYLPVGQDGVLFAVSDGMGGAAAGDVASALVVESLLYNLEHRCEGPDFIQSLKCAVDQANLQVWDAAQTHGRAGMGATLVAVLIRQGTAYLASVGDSRIYLVRAGQIRQLTKDHSYVQMLVDAGVFSSEDAAASPYRNIILQAMGTKPEVVSGLSRLELRRGDRFLLCSDGLTEKVTGRELLDIVENSPSSSAACSRLVTLANERGGEDNITVIVAEVAGDELPKTGRDDRSGNLEIIQEFAPK